MRDLKEAGAKLATQTWCEPLVGLTERAKYPRQTVTKCQFLCWKINLIFANTPMHAVKLIFRFEFEKISIPQQPVE
ncbi:MAG: hypothetical protein CSA25_04690 [Desulfobacter postgatei]|uniref:Uncharacterized protein n=1 Tax=Desulfobacter postgatei TaxID=2293 RepID=A0A2G6MRG5_9BACT|nr:MAG: hypothetical protein CSA25_04690 [Desulfobacter postgatei]